MSRITPSRSRPPRCVADLGARLGALPRSASSDATGSCGQRVSAKLHCGTPYAALHQNRVWVGTPTQINAGMLALRMRSLGIADEGVRTRARAPPSARALMPFPIAIRAGALGLGRSWLGRSWLGQPRARAASGPGGVGPGRRRARAASGPGSVEPGRRRARETSDSRGFELGTSQLRPRSVYGRPGSGAPGFGYTGKFGRPGWPPLVRRPRGSSLPGSLRPWIGSGFGFLRVCSHARVGSTAPRLRARGSSGTGSAGLHPRSEAPGTGHGLKGASGQRRRWIVRVAIVRWLGVLADRRSGVRSFVVSLAIRWSGALIEPGPLGSSVPLVARFFEDGLRWGICWFHVEQGWPSARRAFAASGNLLTYRRIAHACLTEHQVARQTSAPLPASGSVAAMVLAVVPSLP